MNATRVRSGNAAHNGEIDRCADRQWAKPCCCFQRRNRAAAGGLGIDLAKNYWWRVDLIGDHEHLPMNCQSFTRRTVRHWWTAMPASLRPDEIVGRWGLPAYHRDQDRARNIVAARDQCTSAYHVDRSPAGNILMLGHDNPQPQLRKWSLVRGSVAGKTYIGPGPSPAGADDREVVSFDGQVLILKWVDPEIAGRYGIMVLARCRPEETPLNRGSHPRKAT